MDVEKQKFELNMNLSNVKMSGYGRFMLFLHDTEGLAWKL